MATQPVEAVLPYLGVFRAVCETGGFTAAARRLRRTQPSVSYQVRALEELMGTPLFERGGRRLLLTPAGERLRAACSVVFAEIARARGDEPADTLLRLGSASGFGRYVLLPALRALKTTLGPRAPRLDVRFDDADVVLRGLDRGDYEAAFVYARQVTSRRRYTPAYAEELVCIAGRPARRVPRDARSLGAQPFVTYVESDYVFGRWFDEAFGAPPESIASVAHFSELEEVIDAVGAGEGLSIVPRDAAAAHIAAGRLRVIQAGRRTPCLNQVYMVTRASSAPRAELDALLALF